MTTKERRKAQIRHRIVKISYMALPGLKGGYDFPNAGHNKPEYIEKIVCEFYGVTIHSLRTPESLRTLVVKRQAIMFLLRKYTNLTYKEIATRFNRHYSIVISAIKQVKDRMDTTPEFKEQMDFFDSVLN